MSDNGIVLGDMADILPGLNVTAIVTDPVWPNAAVPLVGSDDPYGLFARFVAAIPETVRRAAIILGCDSDPGVLKPMQTRLPFFRVAILEYVRPNYKGRLLQGFDVAYFFGEPPAGTGLIPGKCLMTGAGSRRTDVHPCPRRLDLVEWVVNTWTAKDDFVCDPFAGSGTTILACRLAQRRSIGIEIDPKHHDKALTYLKQNQTIFQMGSGGDAG